MHLSIRALVVSSLVGLFAIASATTASATDGSDVACRTKSADQGTMELVLHWDGATAKGTLQRTALSGNVTTLRLRAERHDDSIVADEINEKDLVSHAAVLRVQNGKRYMRTEASNAWLACQ